MKGFISIQGFRVEAGKRISRFAAPRTIKQQRHKVGSQIYFLLLKSNHQRMIAVDRILC